MEEAERCARTHTRTEEKQKKLDILRTEERAWYMAEVVRQEKRYNEVYDEFYKRFVRDGEDVPTDWRTKDMWGEVKNDVLFKGCYFLNPLRIKSRSQGRH
jgi:hypothetical protein